MPARGSKAPTPPTPSAEELARAARILAIRTRREASGLFVGSYASAFRGGGMEFDESRPYVPGDDLRNFDWNALARTGEAFVKRFREERDQLVLLGLDVSASMGFGTEGHSNGATAAHATALLAAAAGRAGDRVGLATFDDALREEVPPASGPAHVWRVIETAVTSARAAEGRTRLAAGLEALRARHPSRAHVLLVSDFRDPGLDPPDRVSTELRGAFASLVRRHGVVSIIVHDPREAMLPAVGLVRIEDPEAPGRTILVDTNRARVRKRYQRAFALRRIRLEHTLRSLGSDVLWLRSDRDPLRGLMHYFAIRASRAGAAA